VILMAAVLRFRGLGDESLWGDEIRLVSLARRPVTEVWQRTVFPPLHLVTLKMALALGDSEWTARLPSAAAGVLGVAAIMILSAHLWDHRAALPAGVLLALNPFHLTASREAKYFPLVVLLAILSFLCLWRARRNRGWLWGFAVASLAGMYTHTYAALLVACSLPFAVAVVLRRSRGWLVLAATVGLIVLGGLPLFLRALETETVGAESAIGDTPFEPLSTAYYVRLLGTFGPGPRVWPAVVLLIPGAFALLRRRFLGAFVLTSLAGPLVLVAVLRPPIYVDRYLAPSSPFLLLWLTGGVLTVARAAQRHGVVAVQAVAVVLALLLVPACGGIGVAPSKLGSSQEDWKGVAAHLSRVVQPADVVVVAQERRGWKLLLMHYLRKPDGVPVIAAQEVPAAAGRVDSIGHRWWIMRGAERFAPRMNRVLRDGFNLQSFAGLVVVDRGGPCSGRALCEETAWVMQARLLLPMVQWVKPFHYTVLGDLHVAAGDTTRAAAFYRRALALDPTLPRARSGMDKVGRG
jgi:mannosyltransferase